MATPYPLTPYLMHDGIKHVCYEYANLMSAAYWTMKGAPSWRTNVDDAFLMGYRKLADFLPAGGAAAILIETKSES